MVSKAIAYTNVTNDDWVMATPETRLVRVAEDVLEQFGSRTEDGRKITASWSEPYDDGTYEIIFNISGEPELTDLRARADKAEAERDAADAASMDDAAAIQELGRDLLAARALADELAHLISRSDDDGYCRWCKRMVYVWDDSIDQQGGYWDDPSMHAEDCDARAALAKREASRG